jgi:glutamine amidotransferase
MKVAIVKYNSGNTQSVKSSLNRLGVEPIITDDPLTLKAADKVIFPGVGEASTAMQYLGRTNLDACIKNLEQPVLGICLGMQLLCTASEENQTECLAILPYTAERFRGASLKVPHVGWNNIVGLRGPLFEGVSENAHAYFVHSFFVPRGQHTIAGSFYGLEFSGAVACDNFYGVQFHPEKSGRIGARILENFLKI